MTHFKCQKNGDSLIKLRMIVTDLHNMLQLKLGGRFSDNSTSSDPFYKAEMMSIDKLRLLKQGLGTYITFKSFLTTTTNKNRALDFILNNRNNDKNQMNV
jgi:hypothetical protein